MKEALNRRRLPGFRRGRSDVKGFNHVEFVELPFPDFAGDVEARWQAMNGVLQGVIDSYQDPKILDIASGGGHDTLYLLSRGYKVESNEYDPVFLRQFKEKATTQGVDPVIHGVDWRDFLTTDELKEEEFDVLFALGNSFPNYLFSPEERQRALKGFWRVLRPGGTLFFDVRNYDYILGDAENILKDPERNFRYTYGSTYTNQEIEGYPVSISPERVTMRYKHFGNHNWSELDLCPAPIGSVLSDIQTALGDDAEVELFYDYQEEKPEHYDFVQFVVRKPERKTVHLDRLELNTLTPGSQMLIHIRKTSDENERSSTFHAILVDPEKGKAVVRPWVGGGQRNAGYRDAMSTIGTRPYQQEEAEAKTAITQEGEQVDWGGLTFGDELVLRNEEGSERTFFTGFQVHAVEVAMRVVVPKPGS